LNSYIDAEFLKLLKFSQLQQRQKPNWRFI